jgi:hypothetical protein
MIGEVLKGRPRDSYTIATKVPGPGRDKSMADISPAEQVELFRKNFTISLERLGLDYVDIFYLHNVSTVENATLDYILEALVRRRKTAGPASSGSRLTATSPRSSERPSPAADMTSFSQPTISARITRTRSARPSPKRRGPDSASWP